MSSWVTPHLSHNLPPPNFFLNNSKFSRAHRESAQGTQVGVSGYIPCKASSVMLVRGPVLLVDQTEDTG